MFQAFLTASSTQLYTGVRSHLTQADTALLDEVLELTLYEAVARSIPPSKRSECVGLLHAHDPIFRSWLNETSPTTTVVIEEFLMRTLLSLTVQ